MKTQQFILSTVAAVFAGQIIVIAEESPPAPPLPAPPGLPVVHLSELTAALAQAGHELDGVQEHVTALLAQVVPAAVDNAEAAPFPEPPSPYEAGGLVLADMGIEPGGGGAPLVIAFEIGQEKIAETQEDLAILSRILSRAAGREDERAGKMALGILVSSFPGLRRPQAMYLEGYGATFLLNVPFPLAAPAVKDERKPDKPKNTLWEQTRRELYGGRGGFGGGGGVGVGMGGRLPDEMMLMRYGILPGGARRTAAYDAKRVEKLRQELIEALEQGVNLRHVKPEEYLVVVVSSSVDEREVRVVRVEERAGATRVPEVRQEERSVLVPQAAGPGANTLVLRVKKADADALAADKIDSEEFQKRVSVRQY
jgi:hypothetical protein